MGRTTDKTVGILERNWWRPFLRWAAQAYVAGPSLADALACCREVCRRGCGVTLCYWNRADDSPRTVVAEYAAALQALAREGFPCALSVKAPAFGFSSDLLASILKPRRQSEVTVVFDSLESEAVDSTFSLIEKIRPFYSALGCTLPGRWRRSLRDADRLSALGLRVRVVKGQWADPDEPEYDPRAGFLAVVDRLAGQASYVSVATHDSDLARKALKRLRAAGTPCELELLFGLPVRRILRIAEEEGAPVRLYIPYGTGALPYRLSQIRETPAVTWRFFRDLVVGWIGPRAQSLCSAGRRGSGLERRLKPAAVMPASKFD